MSPLSAPSISRLLSYRPPYDWPAILRFLAARAIPGMEIVTEERYRRVVNVRDAAGWIEITHVPGRHALRLTVHHPESTEALPAVMARVRHLFDLDLDPAAVTGVLERDSFLAPLVARRPGLRVPGAWDPFEVSVRAVLGQQITVKAATRLAGKLVAALGTPIPGAVEATGLTHAFPRPELFHVGQIAALGMPRSRAATLAGLATAILTDGQIFKPGRNVEESVAQLRTLPGIGEWTAQYIAMRALRESDAFLAGDVALQRLMANAAGRRPTPRELLARAERWRPWRAYAVLHVWTAGADAE